MPSTTASPSGTWVWRLEPDNTWAAVLKISDSTSAQADVKAVGDVAHVLLHDGSPELVSIEYVAGSHSYQPWTARPVATSISLPGSEIATIDINSTDRMWLATETASSIVVYYSDAPYSSFSGPVTLATGINDDDISVVTALPDDTIGVLWSNQNTDRFGFRVHDDRADAATWSADELPASASALSVGGGMADDHLNVAVAADGTLYAAVKTSYDTGGYPKIALLVRRPNGSWDPLHEVDGSGTRGIVLLNELDQTVRVVYTASEGSNDIVMKSSPTSSISFGPRQTVMSGGLNDVTSTKSNWTDEVLVLASDASQAQAAFLTADTTPSPDLVGQWLMDEGSGSTILDDSTFGNDGTLSGDPTWVSGQHGLALALDGSGDYATVPDAASLDLTDAITIAAWVRPGQLGTQYLVKKATKGGIDGFELSLSSSGKAFFRLNQKASGNTYRIDTTTDYPTDGNTWMHLAATYDGSTMHLYVDGVEDPTSLIVGPSAIATNALALAIGAQPDGDAASLFQGALDDVHLYGRALSPAEIAALADVAPATAPGAPTAVSAIAGDASATVTWTAPASDGGSAITDYRITPDDGAPLAPVSVGSDATSFEVSGLTNGTAYTFTVAALNSVDYGPESDASAAVTPSVSATPPDSSASG